MRTLRLGYRMAECPSHERARAYGESHAVPVPPRASIHLVPGSEPPVVIGFHRSGDA